MENFKTWVGEIGGTASAAQVLGCSIVSVRKYISGERRPKPDLAARIETESKGKVPRVDWYWPS